MTVAVGLFAKPPVPGQVKTRLTPPLTSEQAAALYRAFLVDTARLCDQSKTWTFDVFSPDPEGQEATWPEDAPRPSRFRAQRGRDLGIRLVGAFQELFEEGYERVLILGSDHPTLPPTRLLDALDKLREVDVVLGPSLDGGYYLIGMAQVPKSHLLDDIPWSTPEVLEGTLQRAAAAGLRTGLLRAWYDVDTPQDLKRLARDSGVWGFEPRAATATAGVLAQCPPVEA